MSTQQLVTSRQLSVDTAKAQLTDSKEHVSLEQLEQKLRQHRKQHHHLKSFIASRVAESDYREPLKACFDLVETVNQHLQRQLITAQL